MEKSNTRPGKYGIYITIIVLAIVGIMLLWGDQPTSVTIRDETVKIDGMYGIEIPFSDIATVELIEQDIRTIAPDRVRTNGFDGFGGMLKGYFQSKELGPFMLFVDSSAPSVILIERKQNENVYIGFADAQETRDTYDFIKMALQEE